MAKVNGLGHSAYVSGYDLSGEIMAIDKASGGPAALDMTPISLSAYNRQGGLRTGGLDFTTLMDVVAGHEHDALKGLPTVDVDSMYALGSVIGNPAACIRGLQTNYDWTRDANGMLLGKVSVVSDGFGLEWCALLTAGLRTDGSATNGTSLDETGALSTFGLQAYLQVISFTGTDVTIKIQDSADNSAFADLTGGTFTQTTAAHTTQRIATANNATVRRYLRVATVTTGGFSSAIFAVAFCRNFIAGQVF